jgi:hypothetical protein
MSVRYTNLAAGSLPAPNDVWRVTVKRSGDAARIGLEILTLSLWDTSVQRIATDWTLRVHTAGLGVLHSEPVIDEAADLFVVDMQFDSSVPLVPASRIVATWEDFIANTEVLAVARVTGAARDGAGAVAGQSAALAAGADQVAADSITTKVGASVSGVAGKIGGGVLLLGLAALAFVGLVLEKRLRE